MDGHVAVDIGTPEGRTRSSGPAPSNFAKLRSGPGLRPADVAANQRLRLRTAMALLVFEQGYESVTVRGLSRLAGVSTATFYGHFANTEACLAFACEDTMRQMVERADRARGECRDWREGLQILVSCLAEQSAERPQDAYLTTFGIHIGNAAPTTRAAQASSKTLEGVLMRVFGEAPRNVVAPRRLVAGMAAGLTRVVRTTTLAGKAAELPTLSGQLAEWMLALPGREIMRLRADTGAGSGTHRWRGELPVPDLDAAESPPTNSDERARILEASRRLATAVKPSDLTVSTIRREAGVSRRAFDAIFADATEAVLGAIEETAVDVSGKAAKWAAANAHDWGRRTYLSMAALCAQAAREAPMASVVLSDLTRTGGPGLLCRERLITQAATALRRSTPPTERPSFLVTEASLSAAWQIASDELSRTSAHDLPQTAPFLAYVVLAPAVGARGAVALASRAAES